MGALAALLAGCIVVPLDAPVPAVPALPPVQGPATDLVVIVEAGDSAGESLEGFRIDVDGQGGTWLGGRTGMARFRVAPGVHTVRVAHPWRSFGLLLMVPLPESGELSAQARVDCLEALPCGLGFYPFLHRKDGLLLRSRELAPEEIPRVNPP